MLRFALVVLAVLAVAFVIFALRFRRRIERSAIERAARKDTEAEARRRSRLTGEVEYVIDRIGAEINRDAALSTPGRAERLSQIREVLTRTFDCAIQSVPISGPSAEVIDEFRGEASSRELLYSESGDGRWLQVRADRALLRWTLQELFANVFQHAGSWTRIALLAEPVDGAILLTVRDDGRGLDNAAAARIYAPFTPRAGSRGPGLGLYAVRRIVESMGGSLEVRSAPNDGLVHRIRLPHPASGPYGDERIAAAHRAGAAHQSQ